MPFDCLISRSAIIMPHLKWLKKELKKKSHASLDFSESTNEKQGSNLEWPNTEISLLCDDSYPIIDTLSRGPFLIKMINVLLYFS